MPQARNLRQSFFFNPYDSLELHFIMEVHTHTRQYYQNLITFGSWVKELMVATPFLK